MTEERIAQLEALCRVSPVNLVTFECPSHGEVPRENAFDLGDGRWICHEDNGQCPEDLTVYVKPALYGPSLAEVQAALPDLLAEVRRLRAALEHIRDTDLHSVEWGDCQCSAVARDALAEEVRQ